MSCTSFQQQIALYVGGDLLEKEQVIVEEHLASCESCTKFMVDLEESQLALVKFGQIDIPENIFTNLRASVLAEIRAKEQKTSWWWQIFNFRSNFWRYAVVTISGFMVTAIYLYSFWLNKTSEKVFEISNKEEVIIVPINKVEKNDSINKADNIVKIINKKSNNFSIKTVNIAKKVNKNIDLINKFEIVEDVDSRNDKLSLEALETATVETKVKMEIQTNNPNIRIIWLINKEEKVLQN